MIEEAYEAVEAMGSENKEHLVEELGDVLLQVVLNAQILSENSDFSIVDVIDSINQKMIRRHPHVFEKGFKGGKDIASIKDNWAKIKSEEKNDSKKGAFSKLEKSPLGSLQKAYKIGKRAEKIDFDWDNIEEVLSQFESEYQELKDEIFAEKIDKDKVEDEMGDMFFTLSQVSRHLGVGS